ncbi:MAG: PDZ domain-containing protein [Planctomycetota bacterium]
MAFDARRRLAFVTLFCASAALGWLCPHARAGEPAVATDPPAVQQAKEMVQALGADSYATRQQARNTLLQLGRAAIEPLEYAAQAEDPEVRARAIEILIALRGRGFMGLGLQESEPGEEEGGAAGGAGRTAGRPVVMANQVVAVEQDPLYKASGITKPFPAETAGMQAGDKILAVNDRPVYGVKDLMREVILIGPARVAVLLVDRGGKHLRVSLTLTRNPHHYRSNVLNGIPERVLEGPPPVDLEKEAEQQKAPEKQT